MTNDNTVNALGHKTSFKPITQNPKNIHVYLLKLTLHGTYERGVVFSHNLQPSIITQLLNVCQILSFI